MTEALRQAKITANTAYYGQNTHYSLRLGSPVSNWHYAPAIASGEFIFVSGCTGSQADGSLADGPGVQIRQTFEKVGEALEEAGVTFADVVEMTTYHVGLSSHLELFRHVKDEFVGEPFPVWTAIGVSELVVPGAIVEIRVTARRPCA